MQKPTLGPYPAAMAFQFFSHWYPSILSRRGGECTRRLTGSAGFV